MPDGHYTFAPNLFSKPMAVSASPEGVAVTANAGTRLVPWAQIREVGLSFEPTRFDRERFLCRIVPRTGIPVKILSTTCAGPGSFKLQAAGYRQIVREIHSHLQAHGKSVAYTTGVGKFRYGINVAVTIVTLTLLAPILVMAGAAYLGPLVIIQLIAMGAALPWVWRWIRRNRPATYDPSAIPAGLLPQEPAAQNGPAVIPPRRPKPKIDDYGPIAEPGDSSWCSVGGNTTHWADAERYLAEDLAKWEHEEKARLDAEQRGSKQSQSG